MANRSARAAASCSSDVSPGRVASLRISDRCCSSSSLVRHSIYFSTERGCVPCPFTLQLSPLSEMGNSTKVLKDVRSGARAPRAD
jgi:hypothetical protein